MYHLYGYVDNEKGIEIHSSFCWCVIKNLKSHIEFTSPFEYYIWKESENMAIKELIKVSIEQVGANVKLVVETKKQDTMTKNLELEAKDLVIEDKRTPTP